MHIPGKTISVSTLLNNRDTNPESSLVQILDKPPGGAKHARVLVGAGQPAKMWLSGCAVIPFRAGAGGAVKAHWSAVC